MVLWYVSKRDTRALVRLSSHIPMIQVAVNLLSMKEGEYALSQAFRKHVDEAGFNEQLELIQFDVHSQCK
jgi:hypothetical protein